MKGREDKRERERDNTRDGERVDKKIKDMEREREMNVFVYQ